MSEVPLYSDSARNSLMPRKGSSLLRVSLKLTDFVLQTKDAPLRIVSRRENLS